MKRLLPIVLWAAYAGLWIGGVGAHLLYGATPANVAWAAPAFLSIAGLLILVHADVRRALLAAAMGFAAEVVGVHSGYPFGAYRYADVLAPALFGVPLVIAAAWMILVTYIRQLLPASCLYVPLAALMMAAIDLVIDPIATGVLHYWQWKFGGSYFGIPLSNFGGWVLVSVLIFLTQPAAESNRGVRALGISVILFFTAIAVIHHLWIPAGVGLFLVGLDSVVAIGRLASGNSPAMTRQ